MGQRYTRISTFPENLYVNCSPIIISAGALLKDNKTGKVMVRKFTLYNNALYLMSDFEVWCEIDPYFKGYSSLMFQADTENKMYIPFTPSDYDFNTAGDEIERRLLEEDFYFCICEFPVRKMIRVPIENCVE